MPDRGPQWQLRAVPGNVAQLESASAQAQRITITETVPGPPFDIQLNGSSYSLTDGGGYVLKGFARSDRNRTISVGCAQNHAPWENLGLYSPLDLTADWRSFEQPFQATQTDVNARLHFDLGGSTGVVEISSVRLYHKPSVWARTVEVHPVSAAQADRPESPSPWFDSSLGLAGPSSRGRALVLMYHRVAERDVDPWSLCVSPGRFEQQIDWLQRKTCVVRLCDLSADRAAEDKPVVAVTFDDGYADNLESAKPILVHRETPATVFVSTGLLGTSEEFWWDELERLLLYPGTLPPFFEVNIVGERRRWELRDTAHYSEERWHANRAWSTSVDPPTGRHKMYIELWQALRSLADSARRPVMDALRTWASPAAVARPLRRLLSTVELQSLHEGGLIEIGAHTRSHPVLAMMPAEVQRAEIQGSKRMLEAVIGIPVLGFAYPFGAWGPETLALVRESGFAYACSTRPSAVSPTDDPYLLPRVQVEDWTVDEFERRIDRWLAG